LQVASTSRTFIEQLEEAFGAMFSGTDKTLLTFHGGKTSAEDKERLRQAVADPDRYMVAHCLGYSPTIGPGVSQEAKHYHRGVGIALNRPDDGPDVFTFTHMLQRVRDGGGIDIYYLESRAPKFVPSTKEGVFRAIERQDAELHALVKPSKVLDFLERQGQRPVCNRESAICNIYANNVPARYQSIMNYVGILSKDLEQQGFRVVNRLAEPLDEADEQGGVERSGVLDPDASLSDDEWREVYCISLAECYEIQRKRRKLEGVSELEQKQVDIYHYANEVYKVNYRQIDHTFFTTYCNEKAKRMYLNYRRWNFLPFFLTYFHDSHCCFIAQANDDLCAYNVIESKAVCL
jgi:hypothetical protein